jgi:hypothetical protein
MIRIGSARARLSTARGSAFSFDPVISARPVEGFAHRAGRWSWFVTPMNACSPVKGRGRVEFDPEAVGGEDGDALIANDCEIRRVGGSRWTGWKGRAFPEAAEILQNGPTRGAPQMCRTRRGNPLHQPATCAEESTEVRARTATHARMSRRE